MKKVVRGILITLLILAIVAVFGYLYLYNHGLSGKMPETIRNCLKNINLTVFLPANCE